VSERRKNLIALGVFLLVVISIGLLAYRPATVVGLDGDSLAISFGGSVMSKCEEKDEAWLCRISIEPSSGAQRFVVETKAFGCWDAWKGTSVADAEGSPDRSGCIDALDLISG
jgi:hypothetical protein